MNQQPQHSTMQEMIHRYVQEDRRYRQRIDNAGILVHLEEKINRMMARPYRDASDLPGDRYAKLILSHINELKKVLGHDIGMIQARLPHESMEFTKQLLQNQIDSTRGIISQLDYIASIKNHKERCDKWREWIHGMDN